MHGLYVAWWVREKHVSVAAVAAILAVGDLAVALLEVPTGWFADRRGHRASLAVGSLLQIAGMLFAWLGAGIPGALASSIVIAAGDAFRSGADQALLYRSCDAVGAPDFQRREAQSRALQLAALVLLVLAGGAIVAAWGFAAGWIVETLSCIIGLGIACAMVEPPAASDAIAPDAGAVGSTQSSQPTRVSQIASLVALVAPAAVVQAMAGALVFAVQASSDSEPLGLTLFVAAATLAEAAGACVGGRFAAGIRTQLLLAVVGAVAAAASLVEPRAFNVAVLALCFLMGLLYPLRAAAIQQAIADSVRARAASLASACDKALATVALVAAGFVPRRRSR